MRSAPAREVFGRICMLYAPRVEERAGANESPPSQSRRLRCTTRKIAHACRDRCDADYRWRDLIKHVDCSSAFMANFTLFVSTESYFLSRRDWFMQYARLIRDTSSILTAIADIVGGLVSFGNFFPPRYIALISYASLKYRS